MSGDKLIQIVATAMDQEISTINERSGPISLEKWDSLRHLMLMSMIEESYGVKFAPEDIEKAVSVAKIRALLLRHGMQ